MFTSPDTVQSPKTSVSDVRVIYNTGHAGWALAAMTWEGKPVLGVRWNGDEKNPLGNPQSRGVPTWFVLPDELAALARERLQSEEQLPPLGARVRLQPPMVRIWQGERLAPDDSEWTVTATYPDRGRITISNGAFHQTLPLWSAHVQAFLPDLQPPSDETVRGVLHLTVRIVFEDGHISLWPLKQEQGG